MYTGKGETRDNKKKTTTRTMTQAGSKQQPVEGEAQSGWITTWQGGGYRIPTWKEANTINIEYI
jgi:hypothetical protein